MVEFQTGERERRRRSLLARSSVCLCQVGQSRPSADWKWRESCRCRSWPLSPSDKRVVSSSTRLKACSPPPSLLVVQLPWTKAKERKKRQVQHCNTDSHFNFDYDWALLYFFWSPSLPVSRESPLFSFLCFHEQQRHNSANGGFLYSVIYCRSGSRGSSWQLPHTQSNVCVWV